MSQIKQTLIFFVIAILLLLSSFYAGIRCADKRTEVGISQYQERISSLTGELEAQGIRITAITSGLRWSAKAASELADENRIITEENKRITESIGDIGAGISEDISGLQNVIDRLDNLINGGATEIK